MKVCTPCHRMLLPDHLATACGLREQRYHYLRLSAGRIEALLRGWSERGEQVFQDLAFLPSKAVRHVEATDYAEM